MRRTAPHEPVMSVEEAVAVMAAIERFIGDAAPPAPPPAARASDGWLRAARLEAVERGDSVAWAAAAT